MAAAARGPWQGLRQALAACGICSANMLQERQRLLRARIVGLSPLNQFSYARPPAATPGPSGWLLAAAWRRRQPRLGCWQPAPCPDVSMTQHALKVKPKPLEDVPVYRPALLATAPVGATWTKLKSMAPSRAGCRVWRVVECGAVIKLWEIIRSACVPL